MRKIIYTRPDGGISIVTPAVDEQSAWDKLPSDAINPQWINPEIVPQDRTFRNGWRQNGQSIVHDMPSCRNIWRDRLRELRKPKLEALDLAYLRADETGDSPEKARIAAKKQALRDVTNDPSIEAAQTASELKAIIPDVLKE